MRNGIDYAEVGIDIEKIKKIHNEIYREITTTFDKKMVDVGQHYASLIDFGEKLIAIHCDGVGTKVLIAQMLNKYSTIGIDCIAMNVNDLICVGAKPIAFLDYIALEKMNERIIKEIIVGLKKGAIESNVQIIGGETAIMGNVINGINGNGFDLIGFCIGIVNKNQIITGEKMKPGDMIIGLESSGIHSNGLTLARKALLENYTDKKTRIGILNELLKPTRIYVKPVLEVIKHCKVSGLAHITGGAFSKLRRIGERAGVGFYLHNLLKPQRIFKLIQKKGNIPIREMYRTFNMGNGFLLILSPSECNKALNLLKKFGFNSRIVGKVIKDRSVILNLDSKKIEIESW
jgi:phosphoribosylformylglycinamidine cyclo-ligase